MKSNEARCTSCHIGYGWKDKNFDFANEEKVDCLVCHESTGTYKKFPPGAGYPVAEPTPFGGKDWLPPDLNKVAQSVHRPSRENCGECHFKGGGAPDVKHGDLDTSLYKPKKSLDVHMGADGQNFDCVRCHTTDAHRVAGRDYATPAFTTRESLLKNDLTARISCESCHTETPHATNAKMNDHADKVACQSCHIPAFAREKATKMRWDWSTAGKLKNGKPYKEEGPLGRESYDSMKGDFVWAKNVVPQYAWFNGTMGYVLAGEKVDDTRPVALNRPNGARADKNSRIFPFKVHTGKQPYDSELKTVVLPHLFGKDDDAYWKTYDWGRAIAAGQAYSGLPFSGKFGFLETTWSFPITHQVAPRDKAVACSQCHSRQGRLANLPGFYMPGRDQAAAVDLLGWGGSLAALIGVAIHGLMRLNSRKARRD